MRKTKRDDFNLGGVPVDLERSIDVTRARLCEVDDGRVSGADDVEQVVGELNSICKAATLDFALAVGALIIRRFYGGDLTVWRSRGVKTASFRRLSRHPSLPMSPAALYRSVAIFEMCERLGIKKWKHVSTSHMRMTLGLSMEEQRALLQTAELNRWTVRQLSEEIARRACRSSSSVQRGGRKASPRWTAKIETLSKCIESFGELVAADDEKLEIGHENVHDVLETMRQVREICDLVEKRVSRYLSQDRPTPSRPH
jgi:hypothetical protein